MLNSTIALGFSQDLDVEKAVNEAILRVKATLKNTTPDILIVVSTINYDPARFLPIINAEFPDVAVVGGSTAGIILTDSIQTRGIGICAISSETIKFTINAQENINEKDALTIGKNLAQHCLDKIGHKSRQGCLLFLDSNFRSTSQFLKGVHQIFGKVFPIVGAGNCDDFHFKSNYQIYNNRILKNAVVGLLIGDKAYMGVAGRHGWKPLGKPRVIDEVNGNILRKINGENASNIYKEYFGEDLDKFKADQLDQASILYPLGIQIDGNNEYLLRKAVDILDDGSIVCLGDLPVHSRVHVMIGNKESCILAAQEAALEVKRDLIGKKPQLILVIENMARLQLLGRKCFDGIRKIKEVLGADVPVFGMYSHGEIYPYQTVERFKMPQHQNESIVIMAIA